MKCIFCHKYKKKTKTFDCEDCNKSKTGECGKCDERDFKNRDLDICDKCAAYRFCFECSGDTRWCEFLNIANPETRCTCRDISKYKFSIRLESDFYDNWDQCYADMMSVDKEKLSMKDFKGILRYIINFNKNDRYVGDNFHSNN